MDPGEGGQDSIPEHILHQLENARAGGDDSAFLEIMHSLSGSLRRANNGGEEIGKLVDKMSSTDDPGSKMAILSNISEILSLSTDEFVSGDTIETLVPTLCTCLDSGDAQMALLATRALNSLLDIIPDAANHAVDEGMVPLLIARLFSVEYIDVAEVSLKALENISEMRPMEVLKEGYMSAALSLAGFFSMNYQRVIANTCSRMFNDIPDDCVELILESISGVADLLQYDDMKVLESTCKAFKSLVSRFSSDARCLVAIVTPHVQRRLLTLLTDPQGISTTTWDAAINALETAATSDTIALQLFENGAAGVICGVLTSSHKTSVRNSQQLRSALSLCLMLLPRIAATDAPRNMVEPNRRNRKDEIYAALLVEQPELVQAIVVALLPAVLDVYSNTANPQSGLLALTCAARLVHLAPIEVLPESMSSSVIAPILTTCLESQGAIVGQALFIINGLLTKLSSVYANDFVREGVIRALSTLNSDEGWIISESQRLLSLGGADESGSDVVQMLDDLASRFSSMSIEDGLSELKALLESPLGVSAHEFSKSNIIHAIVKAIDPAIHQPDHDKWLVDGYPLLKHLATCDMIIDKVLYSLEKSQRFGLVVCDPDGTTSFMNGMRQLLQPLRLNLKPHPDGVGLGVVRPSRAVIDALAPVNAIEQFISSRVTSVEDVVEEEEEEEEEQIHMDRRNDDEKEDISVCDVGSASVEEKASTSIELSINGKVMPHDVCIVRAVYKTCDEADIMERGLQSIWNESHTVHYRLNDTNKSERMTTMLLSSNPESGDLSRLHSLVTTDEVVDELILLHVLHALKISRESAKITAKLSRQINDVLAVGAGAMPKWAAHVVHDAPYLVSFSTRRSFLNATAFGVSRALMHVNAGDNQQVKIGRLPRQKVRIHRDKLLDSAMKLMDMYAADKSIIEIEYHGEPGSGSGPSQEFYSLVSVELRRESLGIWWNSSNDDLVPDGLFPRPGSEARYYTFMGKFVGKALKDDRLVDLAFSDAFLRLMLGQKLTVDDMPFDLTKLSSVDDIDDLCLTFVVPGYDIELKPDGANISVTKDTLSEYMSLMMDMVLDSGIRAQIDAFVSGFSSVFDIEHLRGFNPSELDLMLRGEEKPWGDELVDVVHADHGYTPSSNEIVSLVSILQGFNADQRRSFIHFVTGSPRLPTGGIHALSPPLTVVRKTLDRGTPDDYLPSVMTCMNYLKLPAYSSVEVMRERLLAAISLGVGFHLS